MAELSKKDYVNITTLESHLWEAANILRGPVDASDFKTFIFPLLFFKRIHWRPTRAWISRKPRIFLKETAG